MKRKKYRNLTINGKTVKEHRYVMEQAIGRKLSPKEVVHHLDGNGMNNDLSNLELMPYNKHCQMESRKIRPAAKLSINAGGDPPIINITLSKLRNAPCFL